MAKPTLSLRVHGGAARVVHLAVDDVRLGSLRLPGDETRILASISGSTGLARGRHRIALRFSGAPRASKNALAELDWVRLSEPDSEPTRYGAPTEIPAPGLNYRLSDVLCALGVPQVERLESLLAARERVAGWYEERIGHAVGVPAASEGDRHGWQAYVVTLDRRDEALEGLRADGIQAQIGTYAVNTFAAYRDRRDVPVAVQERLNVGAELDGVSNPAPVPLERVEDLIAQNVREVGFPNRAATDDRAAAAVLPADTASERNRRQTSNE